MASRKNLKKVINYATSQLFSECVAVSLYSSKPEEKDVNPTKSVIEFCLASFRFVERKTCFCAVGIGYFSVFKVVSYWLFNAVSLATTSASLLSVS